MKQYIRYTLICCLFYLAGCHPGTSFQLPEDNILYTLLQNAPDSLAILLEDIDPSSLPEAEQANYGWWLTNAHHKQNRSLINDTLIQHTLEYYKLIKSPRLIDTYQLAAFQIIYKKSDSPRPKELLMEGLQVATQEKDTAAIQQICSLILRLYEAPENDLIRIIKKYMKPGGDVTAYQNLSYGFIYLGQLDSASHYLQKGFDLAHHRKDHRKTEFLRLYIGTLNAQGKHKDALKILHSPQVLQNNPNEFAINYLNSWFGLGQLDSVQAYIDSNQAAIDKYKTQFPEQMNTLDLLNKSFKMLLKAKKGENISIYDIGTTADNIRKFENIMVYNDRERQFTQSKLQRKNLMLAIEHEQLRQRFLWIGIIVVCIISILLFIYQRKLLKKEKQVQSVKEQLHLHIIQLSKNESIICENEKLINSLSAQLDESGDLKSEIEQLTSKNNNLIQKNKVLQTDIERLSESGKQQDCELLVYKRLMEQNARLKERERFLTVMAIANIPVLNRLSTKAHYIDYSQWPEIVNAANHLFDGFTYRLQTEFPVLTEEDVRYCCLLKLQLSTSVIATLMGISPSSVTKRKQRIKEKVNQQKEAEISKEQSLESYLWNY